MFQKIIHQLQMKAFDAISILTVVLYIAIAFGLWSNAPQYLGDLQYYVKIYVALFLIYRFNPFRHVKFTSLDRRIGFSAGMFLLGTSLLQSLFPVMN
jgi:hypothetical protein